MQKSKKLLSLILTIVMVAGLFVNCFAEPVGPNPTKLRVATPNEQSVPVNLTAAADTFNVTIPTILPITVNDKGITFAASNTKITNNGKNPLSIKSIDIKPISGWSIVPTNTDFSKVAIGSNQMGFNMFGMDVLNDGTFSVDSFQKINGGDSLALPYYSQISAQKTNETNISINLLFTVDCEHSLPPPPVIGTVYDDGTYMYTYGGGFEEYGGAILIPEQNGWNVQLKDRTSTAPVTKAPLTSIQGYPVTNMSYMFFNSQATSIDLSGFDTSNVTDMHDMFVISEATSLDLSSFDTSNVTDMHNMFESSAATIITFPIEFGSNATDMSYMFADFAATTLNCPAGFGKNATDMSWMFYYSAATTLDFPAGFGSKATNMVYMFSNSAATTLNFTAGFGGNATNMGYMFFLSEIKTLNLPEGFGNSATNVFATESMFYYSAATTGYTETQAEADKWNNSTATTKKPAALTFTVKP